MKDTPALRRFLRSYLTWLCDEFSIDKPPLMFHIPWDDARLMGAFDSDGKMFVNLEEHSTVGELLDTIGHELAHQETEEEYPSHGQEWKSNARRFGAAPRSAGRYIKKWGCRGNRS